MKAVELLMRDIIPDDIETDGVSFDKKGIGNLMSQIASKYPDKYREISKQISDVGRKESFARGETITLADMYPTFDKDKVIAQMKQEVKATVAKFKKPEDRKNERLKIYAKYSELLEKLTVDSIKGTSHNLGNSVISGARGNRGQLKSMITTPAVYTDYKDDMIDMFIENSYGEGLRPAEYLSSTFGARKAVISTKEATADAGDLAKQMVQSVTKMAVTEDDCGTTNGVALDVGDAEELAGRVIQRSYGKAAAGEAVDKNVHKALRASGKERILARSPMTCQSRQGVCSKCAGLNNDGKFPVIGENVGMTAAHALGEPLTQGALNVKHSGGQFGGTKIPNSGFKVVNQIMQSPNTYPNKATLSSITGRVEAVEDAPQGGTNIVIDGKSHYALPGFPVNVKKGDEVEVGDRLSDGILDVKDMISLRGLGSGRQHYVNYLQEVFDNSGLYASKKNLEYLARGSLDHVRISGNEEVAGFLPDDLASYNGIASSYTPPKDAIMKDPSSSIGKYLHNPAMHYTVGTKVTKKMSENLKDMGFNKLVVSDNPAEFNPEMVRLRTATMSEKDWMSSLHSSYQAHRLNNAALSGGVTNIEENIHFAPRLAYGKGFGDKSEQQGML
jgi:DNA-directed RNA polymerase subunit beta'